METSVKLCTTVSALAIKLCGGHNGCDDGHTRMPGVCEDST